MTAPDYARHGDHARDLRERPSCDLRVRVIPVKVNPVLAAVARLAHAARRRARASEDQDRSALRGELRRQPRNDRSGLGDPRRELAAHKLPDVVEALIERAQAMRAWLLTATDCSCTSLDVCALFDRYGTPVNGSNGAERLHVTHVGGVAAGS